MAKILKLNCCEIPREYILVEGWSHRLGAAEIRMVNSANEVMSVVLKRTDTLRLINKLQRIVAPRSRAEKRGKK